MKLQTVTLTIVSCIIIAIAVSCTTQDDDSEISKRLQGLKGHVFTDPSGDTFGSETYQHDILSIEVFHDPDTYVFYFKIIFADTVRPVSGPFSLEQLYGYLELDVDQVQDSGSESAIDTFISFSGLNESPTNMFVDYTVTFHVYDGTFKTLNITTPDYAGELVGYAPVIYEGNTCLVLVPIDAMILYDGSFKFGLLIGSSPEATDLTQGYAYVEQ
jgi:hypothetical protein